MTLHDCIELTRCPACHAENGSEQALGMLGRKTWIRCQYCGMDYTISFNNNRTELVLRREVIITL